MQSQTMRRGLLAIGSIGLALFLYQGVARPMLASIVTLPSLPGGISALTLLVMVFSFTHAVVALGWRHSLIFFALSAVISWTFEQVGVATGAVYGPYHYTDQLGPKLGHVPLLIPIAWFMMIYPSYIIANLIADGQPTGSRGGLGRILSVAFLSAMVMTAWDLVVDPLLSKAAMTAWIWEQGGPYYGVPVQNFFGWMLTTFTVYTVYRLYESKVKPRPIGSLSRTLAALPLIAYGGLMIADGIGNVEGMAVIAPFVMGLPIVAAALRLPVRPTS